MKNQHRLAAIAVDNLNLDPLHVANTGSKRFCCGFLGGKSSSQRANVPPGVCQFIVGVEATEESFAIRDWFRDQLLQGLSPQAFSQFDEMHALLSARKDWRPQHASGQYVQMIYDAPLCLSTHDVDQVLDRFELDDATRSTIGELLDDYQRDCRTNRTEALEATSYTDGPLELRFIELSLQRDARLIEHLMQSIESEEATAMIGWLLPIRHRRQYARNIYGGGEIDPVSFLLDAELSTDQLHRLTPVIDEYNRKANPLYLDRYRSVVRYQRENPEDFARNHINENYDEVYEMNRRIAILNDETIRRMTESLPEQLGTRILDTFLRTSHPFVYEDDGRLHLVFQRPSLKETLTDSQRLQIDDLQAEYMSRYTELTDAMVALCIDADGWVGGQTGEPFNVPTRMHGPIAEYAPLHIERDELNAATNIRIRTILTPQQVKAMGGIPNLK